MTSEKKKYFSTCYWDNLDRIAIVVKPHCDYCVSQIEYESKVKSFLFTLGVIPFDECNNFDKMKSVYLNAQIIGVISNMEMIIKNQTLLHNKFGSKFHIVYNDNDGIKITCDKIEVVKISAICKDNAQRWVIVPNELDEKQFKEFESNMSHLINDYHKVPDYVFKRAFQPIYVEMLLQFKLNGDIEQLKLLESLFQLDI